MDALQRVQTLLIDLGPLFFKVLAFLLEADALMLEDLAVFVVDVLTDNIAVREARKLKVPVIGLIDSNGDPSSVDYPIPSNDDATKTINLVLDYVQAAIEEGKGKVKPVASSQETVDRVEKKPEAVGKNAKPVDASPAPRLRKAEDKKVKSEEKSSEN